MKLVRYGPPGQEKPGLIDGDGRVRALADHITDITPDTLAPEVLAKLKGLDVDALPLVGNPDRFGPPVVGSQKFLGIGLNYKDHAAEIGMDHPAEPIVFTKHLSCLSGPNDDVVLPRGSQKADWEVELGVVMGKRCQYAEEAEALEHVAGYCLINDISERAFQIERGGQWVKGKSCDTFGPIGPWLVTADEVPDPQNLTLKLSLNGETMQDGTTADMIFTVAQIIAHLSQFMTLLPGDLICTGTPAGVGMGMKPQRFLQDGDVMELELEGMGRQRQRVLGFQ